MLCGAAVLMVTGTLARLDAPPPALVERGDHHACDDASDDASDDAAQEGFDGELEGEPERVAGDVLFAAPALEDPYFANTAIYVVAHDEHGALGVVLNRPRDLAHLDSPVFEGGPVGNDRVVVLHDEPTRGIEVEYGIYAAADPSLIEDVIHGNTFGKVFVGYAGWGPGQLDRELAEGTWLVSDATAVTVLGMRPREGGSSVVY